MKISIQIVIDHENDQPAITRSIAELKRENLAEDSLGMTLLESKLILKNIQSELAERQIDQYINEHQICETCQKPHKIKGHNRIVYRTLFGKLNLKSVRHYSCSCRKRARKSVSPLSKILTERTSPELQFLQAKWASLVSYGMSLKILEDVLPVQSNIAAVFNNAHKAADRLDAEIGDEKYFHISGCQAEWDKLPYPDSPLTVGIDGGYIHAREGKNRKAGWFEAIVGKSLQDGKPSKRFGFVCQYDDRPKSRLNATLRKQGLQMNQDITFLSDGGKNVRELQTFISPQAEHILDWFHITMKITVMRQMVKGLRENERCKLDKRLDSVKWYIWHGNVDKALERIEIFRDDIEPENGDKQSGMYKLWKYSNEFYLYIASNRGFIPNYGDRHRYGEIISSAFVESTVNEVVSRRMVKKQQMRWTKKGAHKMIQVRTSTLNEELREAFCNWYPGMEENSDFKSQLVA